MYPVYKILSNNADITKAIAERLYELIVVDNAGFKNDKFTLRLDDQKPWVKIPKYGTKVQIFMGYQYKNNSEMPSVIGDMGIYYVDEAASDNKPNVLTITGRSADTGGTLKFTKSRTWEDTTIKEILSTIAAEHGKDFFAGESVADEYYDVKVQHNSSDQKFLAKIAHEKQAIFKVVNDTLIIARRGETKSKSGGTVVPFVLTDKYLNKVSWRIHLVNEYTYVSARYMSKEKGKQLEIKKNVPPKYVLNPDEKNLTLDTVYPSAEEAMDAIDSAIEELIFGKERLTLNEMVGHPLLRAERKIYVYDGNIRPEIYMDQFSGKPKAWLVSSITHRMVGSSSTYTMSADCEIWKEKD